MTIKSVDVIADILEDKQVSKTVKLNASKSILDYTLKIREQNEIIKRLNNIEKQVNQNE